MTQNTDYHDWTLPSPGGDAGTWGETLNALFDGDLEASVVLRGAHADRPASAPTDGIYHATDRAEYYRYDGSGWVDLFAHVAEARQRHTDAKRGPTAAYRRVGAGRLGDLRHSQSTVGTRRLAAHWPLVAPSARSGFDYSGTGVNERVQLINYQFLEQPPNMEPVLRVMASGASDTSGETFEVGVRHRAQASGEWLTRLTFGTDTDTHQLYDEVRLNETAYGSAARGVDTLSETTIEVHADIDGTPTSGALFGASSIVLSWEVV